MYSDITGIILAGGKSTRMGVNKSLLKIGEQTIVERIADLMKSVFAEVIVISNTPDDYKFLNLPVYEDVYKGKGPIGGIHSGLKNSQTEKNLFISCDVPLMNKETIEYIVNYETDKLIKVCRIKGFIQPLPGMYDRRLLDTLEKILSGENAEGKDRRNKLLTFIESGDAEIINPESAIGYAENTFLNINTQEDYNNLLAMINKQQSR
ncbi:MAG: molybdenum cofactor guanylyltransferase [Ignavibacteriae bacterium]|nr:molybdenum cofactor guanylyltransferase [Ignavibacteriota bacterium]